MEALLDLQAGDPYLLLNIHLPPAIWRIAAAAMDLAVLSDVREGRVSVAQKCCALLYSTNSHGWLSERGRERE